MSTDPKLLLVLGAVLQEQPATAYAIMRELTGWGVQDWASVNPGSIYGAVRALVKDGFLIETAESPIVNNRSYKNSAKYRVTPEGEIAFSDLLGSALAEVTPYRTAPFMAALCFLTSLPRPEVVSILEERARQLESSLRQMQISEEQTILDPGKPSHSVEFVKLGAQQVSGELVFTQALLGRVRTGTYTFPSEVAKNC